MTSARGVVGLVGAGPVGTALLIRLRAAGWSVGTVASRTLASARAAVDLLGRGTPSDHVEDALRGADLCLVAVPDRAIRPVGEALAASGAVPPGLLALHVSGAEASEILAPLRAAGAAVGSLHPLQTFADPVTAADTLSGTYLFFEGDDPERIRAVAEDLGGRPVPIDRSGKTLYHAGAAAACNLAASMIDLGLSLFERAGIGREDALPALLPLVRGTIRNIEQVGLPAALTGPVARGDVETVRSHLEAISAAAPELLPPYVGGSLHAVEVGVAKGTLDDEAARALRDLLEGYRG